MANRFFPPDEQFADSTGRPYANGTLSFFVSGSSTPQNVFSDQALAHSLGNVITLDSSGRAGSVFLQNATYKVVLADAFSNTIWTQDPVYTSDLSTPSAFVTHPGNPNGAVAGNSGTLTVAASAVWDTTNQLLYVCTTTGNRFTAAWTVINAAPVTSVPTGTIMSFAGTVAPNGFLLCAGQLVSTTTFATLFALIGTTYGSGSGTFGVPDLRGRAVFSIDSGGSGRITVAGGNFDGTVQGNSGGGQNETLTQAQMPAVPPLAPSFTGTGMTGNGSINGGPYTQSNSTQAVGTTGGSNCIPGAFSNPTIGPGSFVPTGTLGNMGSGSAHTILDPAIIMNFVIKT